jgi:uncharacterized protein YecE (DUF72 family)
MPIFIGCAGWNLRKEFALEFPVSGTHLERYASRFNCVEINSSFYRPHRRTTYERWAACTPDNFRFSVKLPKLITHIARLVDVGEQVREFATQTSGLGEKLGSVLVQLPPSLDFDAAISVAFFKQLEAAINVPIACEPRHHTWFEPDAASLITDYKLERVAADPSVVPEAAIPGGAGRDIYYRWHGSPRIYYSSYKDESLAELANHVRAIEPRARSVQIVFDNTAHGFATQNALRLKEMLQD